MKILRFCFQCSGKYSELLPGDLETSALFLEDLISMSLKGLSWLMIVDRVMLSFSHLQNMFTVQIRVWCYDRFKEPSDEAEDIELQVESLISYSLLQMFRVVFVNNLS